MFNLIFLISHSPSVLCCLISSLKIGFTICKFQKFQKTENSISLTCMSSFFDWRMRNDAIFNDFSSKSSLRPLNLAYAIICDLYLMSAKIRDNFHTRNLITASEFKEFLECSLICLQLLMLPMTSRALPLANLTSLCSYWLTPNSFGGNSGSAFY